MTATVHNLNISGGGISATVNTPVPETRQAATVKLSQVQGDRLRSWARKMRARYDAAQTTDDNIKHWASADNLSALAANSPQVRYILRNRSRYEIANNSYAQGMKLTLANHTVGTGPRLRLLGPDKGANRDVQNLFMDWAVEVALAENLRVARMDKFASGEAFIGLVRKRRLESPVQLGLTSFEADRISDPTAFRITDPQHVDGILFDDDGEPIEYKVLKYHPGDYFANPLEPPDVFPAKSMCHWFLRDRSGQLRGIPEITPALRLFADLRRFTLAVIAAAETVADAAGVIYSESSALADDEQPEPMDTVDIEKRMFLTLPAGWKMGQIEAQQPVTTYAEFKREILKEIARCLNMPYCIAAGDSSDYNFASGRLDHQIYVTSIWVDRSECERVALRKIFRSWFREAQAVTRAGTPYLPDSFARMASPPPFGWFWDELDLGDQVKKATAREISLRNGFGDLITMCAEDGEDWEIVLSRNAEALGITVPEYQRLLRDKIFDSANNQMPSGDPPAPPAPPTSAKEKHNAA